MLKVQLKLKPAQKLHNENINTLQRMYKNIRHHLNDQNSYRLTAFTTNSLINAIHFCQLSIVKSTDFNYRAQNMQNIEHCSMANSRHIKLNDNINGQFAHKHYV